MCIHKVCARTLHGCAWRAHVPCMDAHVQGMCKRPGEPQCSFSCLGSSGGGIADGILSIGFFLDRWRCGVRKQITRAVLEGLGGGKAGWKSSAGLVCWGPRAANMWASLHCAEFFSIAWLLQRHPRSIMTRTRKTLVLHAPHHPHTMSRAREDIFSCAES